MKIEFKLFFIFLIFFVVIFGTIFYINKRSYTPQKENYEEKQFMNEEVLNNDKILKKIYKEVEISNKKIL